MYTGCPLGAMSKSWWPRKDSLVPRRCVDNATPSRNLGSQNPRFLEPPGHDVLRTQVQGTFLYKTCACAMVVRIRTTTSTVQVKNQKLKEATPPLLRTPPPNPRPATHPHPHSHMSVLSGALGHVLWRDGEAAEAKLFPVRVTAVDEITATFDCECLAYRGSSSKDLPFDRFILDDPDGHVGMGSTLQVQPAVSSFEAVPTGLPKHWVDEDGHELKVGAVLATCEDSSGKPVALVIKAEIAKLTRANLARGMPGTNRGPSGQGDRAATNGRMRCTRHGYTCCPEEPGETGPRRPRAPKAR